MTDEIILLKQRNLLALDSIQNIIDIGFDYDGFKSSKDLKELIDELVGYARDAKAYLIETKGEKQMEIKDSGDRRQFESGAVRDMAEGKGRMDLLPWAAIMEVSKHCENGAKKYGEHNVDKGLPTHSFCDSAARHLAKYLDGWTDEQHLLAAAWNLLWAIEMELKHPECVDTPWKQDK